MELVWKRKVQGIKRKSGEVYPLIYLPAVFRPWVGKTVKLIYRDGRLILVPEDKEYEKSYENS